MKCSQPFMRDTSGRVHWSTKLTEEERLNMTPFPCGRCLPCRINKARTWQHRIMLETNSHDDSIFVTLTYSDDFLPITSRGDPTLVKTDLQKFFKRLRRRLNEKTIRYFAVGEYGDRTERPHYHTCIFGLDPSLNTRSDIESAWSIKHNPIGHVHIGRVEKESARYIAGYTIKKLTDPNDERLQGRYPEFMLSSRKGGGIGAQEVRRIAKHLKKSPYFDVDQIINTFQIGGKNYPLGSYLTKILVNELGTDEKLLKQMLFNYQQKIFQENDSYSEDYYFNIIEQSDNYRKRLEKKYKIYNKEKKL